MPSLHVVMFPCFAHGHITSFLHISNKLAEKGHTISFLLPRKTQPKFEPFNLHPHLITFIPLTLPHVDGLPTGAETIADVTFSQHTLLMTAMDLTEPTIETLLIELKPDFIFFDFTHWTPALSSKLGVKSIYYCTISPATAGYLLSPDRKLADKSLLESDLLVPPPNFPPLSSIKLRAHETRGLAFISTQEYGRGISFAQRQVASFRNCDAICFKTCREMEGEYCEYVKNRFGRPVFFAGPVLPEQPAMVLDEQWSKTLDNFEPKTMIFCAFGSECILEKKQFQELVLGFELSGYPFLVALKAPAGFETMESALPTGFSERVKGRGFIHDGWVQQQLILKHKSMGCFVTHCGSESLSEAMVNECQIVLLPYCGDQVINARLMGGDLKVGVEVEKGEEDGLFSRYGVCEAVKTVMDDDNEIGKQVRTNHSKWRNFLLSKDLENSYINSFVDNLCDLLK